MSREPMFICALLESMWGWRGYNTPGEEAPRFFRINPDNFSGRRLYRLLSPGDNMVVTNSCRTVQRSASQHGTPDPTWVKENLEKAKADGTELFLVCGKVAKSTYEKTGLTYTNVLFIDHPAARRWTRATELEVINQIAAMRPQREEVVA